LIFFIVVSAQAQVQTDPKVKPTIAADSADQDSSVGRIVINAYYEEGGNEAVYSQENTNVIEDLSAYVESEKDRLAGEFPGREPLLHLRCDRRLEWKDIQHVKVEAGKHGVNQFNFASYQGNPE